MKHSGGPLGRPNRRLFQRLKCSCDTTKTKFWKLLLRPDVYMSSSSPEWFAFSYETDASMAIHSEEAESANKAASKITVWSLVKSFQQGREVSAITKGPLDRTPR